MIADFCSVWVGNQNADIDSVGPNWAILRVELVLICNCHFGKLHVQAKLKSYWSLESP